MRTETIYSVFATERESAKSLVFGRLKCKQEGGKTSE